MLPLSLSEDCLEPSVFCVSLCSPLSADGEEPLPLQMSTITFVVSLKVSWPAPSSPPLSWSFFLQQWLSCLFLSSCLFFHSVSPTLLCSKGRVRHSQFSLMPAGEERKKGEKWPFRSPVCLIFFFLSLKKTLRKVHLTSLAGSPSHWVCPVHFLLSAGGRRRKKKYHERLVSRLKPESMHHKLEAQTAQIHSWTNHQPCCWTCPFLVIWKNPLGNIQQQFDTSWGQEGYSQPEIRNITK